MSEIDISKCDYKCGIECHIRDYPILNCVDVKIEDCYYKQLQQLKAENEELRARNSRGMLAFLEEDFKKEQKIKKYKQCLDDIEKICNNTELYEWCEYAYSCKYKLNDILILQKIKEVKQDGNI